MKNSSLDLLFSRYIEAAINYGDGIYAGDGELFDKGYDELKKVFLEIKTYKDEGFKGLAKFFKHENVRLWAASHLLDYPEFDSITVLNKLKASETVLGLTAEIIIDAWKKGVFKD